MDSQFVIYTSVALPYIDVDPNDNLQLILGKINTAVNNSSSAPNYSGYNLYCVTQTDGVSHPTNTQNFAEGISKILCDLIDDFDQFVNTDYPADQLVLTTAIENLQEPSLTYVPFGITSADLIGTVYTKMFTGFNTFGFNTLTSTIDPYTSNWATLSITPSHSVITTWNNVITYISNLVTTVSGKQTSLGTFNTTSIGGASGTAPIATINEILSYIVTLPEFDAGSITFGGVTTATDLQDTVQNTIDSTNYLLTNAVISANNGITIASIGGTYDGKRVSMNQSYMPYYKVAISSGDSAYDYLEDKVTSLDGSITIDTSTNPDKLDLSVTNPADGKIKITQNDTNEDYLLNKINTTTNTSWGITLYPTATSDDNKLDLNFTIDPNVFIPQFFEYVSTNPDLLARWCALNDQCDGCLCDVISDLLVAKDGSDFVLTWTPTGGSTTSQTAKYRQEGDTDWITLNFNPTNPLSDTADTTTAENLNTNTVYQFQVDSQCPGDVSNSNIYEMVIYEKQTVDVVVDGDTINVSQNPLPNVRLIDYRLLDSGDVVVDTATNINAITNPSTSFTGLAADTYKVQWRYKTIVNGVLLTSDIASQLNGWSEETGIIVT